MPWDANIATTEFKGKLPLQSMNNLMGAIRERCQGAGVAIPAIFAMDYTKFELLPKTWFSTFQSTITTLIPAYVNHTDNSGDWNGQTTIPAWTEATILTAIGDASRLPAPSSQICAKWFLQQFEILNLLRWRKIIATAHSYTKRISPTYGPSISWTDSKNTARAAFIASSAVYDLVSYAFYDYCAVVSLDGFGNKYFSDIRTTSQYDITVPYSGFNGNLEVDYYARSQGLGGASTGYDLDSAGVVVNTKKLLYSNTVNPATIGSASWLTQTFDVSEFPYWSELPADITGIPAGYIFNKSWELYKNSLSDPLAILKFTGPNGFGFRDWEV